MSERNQRPPAYRTGGGAPTGAGAIDLGAERDRSRRRRAAREVYDWTWRKLSRAVLAMEPLCRACMAAGRVQLATEVDHIIPAAERPDLRLERGNLQPLCKPCHSQKTSRGSVGAKGRPAPAQA